MSDSKASHPATSAISAAASSRAPLCIVNPKSGGGSSDAALAELERVVRGALGDVDFARTERSLHAVDIARRAASEGRELVIAVGGDGSIHEVVTGLMAAREEGLTPPKLGIIGQGTGGDFRKTLGLEHRLDRYLSALAGGATRKLDIGRFDYVDNDGNAASNWFVNILSAGMGGLVDRYVHETSKRLGGTAAYFFASARGLLESVVCTLRVKTWLGDRLETRELTTRQISICNGQYFGSGMQVAPMADVSDGVFEVIDMGAASKLKFALGSSAIYKGRHLDNPEVTHFRCDRIELDLVGEEGRGRFLLDVDGEPLGRLPLRVEVVPHALEVIVPG